MDLTKVVVGVVLDSPVIQSMEQSPSATQDTTQESPVNVQHENDVPVSDSNHVTELNKSENDDGVSKDEKPKDEFLAVASVPTGRSSRYVHHARSCAED